MKTYNVVNNNEVVVEVKLLSLEKSHIEVYCCLFGIIGFSWLQERGNFT